MLLTNKHFYFLENKGGECSVKDVMIFLSGSATVPPAGFAKKPTVTFLHESRRKFATASTCDLQFRLPVCHDNDYNSFKDSMILSFKCNDGFGGP